MPKALSFFSTMPRIGLFLGPLVATLIWLVPSALPVHQHRVIGLIAWVFVWWISEAIPLAATSIFGAALGVILGISDTTHLFSRFAHPSIFLCLGGFFMARSMEVHGLDRRIALFIVSRHWVAGKPWRVVVALGTLGAFIAMWVSNTATMAMMLPIALGILGNVFPDDRESQGTCLMAIAYAVSIGGMGTPIGTTPNLVTIGFIESMAKQDLEMLQWMSVGVPVMVMILLVMFWLTRRSLPTELPITEVAQVMRENQRLGPLTRAEKNVIGVLFLAVSFWIFPSIVETVLGTSAPFAKLLDRILPESVVSIVAATFLFLLPDGNGRSTLLWNEAVQIDWGSLFLFGGGLAIGGMFFDSGLSKTMGDFIIAKIGSGTPYFFFAGFLVYFTIFLGEFTSNTACANMMVPIAISIAQSVGFSPVKAAVALGLASSIGFMTPISTATNAIAFSSGLIPLKRMMRTGLVINLAGGLIIIVVFQLLRIFKIHL